SPAIIRRHTPVLRPDGQHASIRRPNRAAPPHSRGAGTLEGKPECRRTDMEAAEVSRQLRALVEERLFGNGPWSSDDPAVNYAVHDKLSAWGLQMVDPVTQDIHTTELGRKLQVELMSVFMGTTSRTRRQITCGTLS